MNFIEWLKVILLGIVEGITEWLPISSTGHLILVDEFVKLNQSEALSNAPKQENGAYVVSKVVD